MLFALVMLAPLQIAVKPGDILEGRYVLRERIGQGGMGSVFLADQPALKRTVAIKVLHPEFVGVPDRARRIREEAVVACRVRNPHCIEVFDCSALPDGTPYIVMEHVPGRPLGRIIRDERISLARVVDLFGQILDALAATHHCGIVHGDVKSNNFLVELLDGAEYVTMIDFGLAQVVGSPVHIDLDHDEVTIAGTPEYMAPEVVAGEPPRFVSDLYGAGVILYELLTGITPFGRGKTNEIMMGGAYHQVIPPSQRRPDRGIPPAVDRVVLRALEEQPEARFPDAEAFARELRLAAGVQGDATGQSVAPGEAAMHGSLVCDAGAPQALHRSTSGTDCGNLESSAKFEALHRTISEALRGGDVAAIADGYLELASALASEGWLARAPRELEEGIDILTARCDPRAAGTLRQVDRLVVALAALYEKAGDRKLARLVATGVDCSPTRTYAIR